MKDASKLFLSLLICFSAGAIGQLFTFREIPTWYASLHKAWFNPPNYVFGPVWTILYVLMAVSLFLIWRREKKSKARTWGIRFFFMQLLLNTLWSLIFFGAHAPLVALGDILLLGIFILFTMIAFYKVSKVASLLLLPYLLWVSFASVLNLFVVLLNR